MRIACLTGSLEPGRDGVGDYTRTLATECTRLGHAVCLLSVGENHSPPDEDPSGLPTRRLAGGKWSADGGRPAREYLEAFTPDWTSLQFVPYSFNPRGFFGAKIPALNAAMQTAPRRHIFFHETWIGMEQGARLKARLSGWWQRQAVKRMLREMAPACVHTSVDYYRAALASVGQPAEVLSMFGSVPRPPRPCVPEALPGVPRDALVGGMFGTLHPDWQPDAFLRDFVALAAAAGRPPALVAAGSMGPGTPRFEKIKETWRGKLTAVALGRCTEERLAAVFARFDFAVTSVPWNILGKSSSAAALREHGIRVVVTAAGTPPRFPTPPLEDTARDEGFIPYFLDRTLLALATTRTVPRAGVPAVATRLLAAFSRHE